MDALHFYITGIAIFGSGLNLGFRQLALGCRALVYYTVAALLKV